MKLVRQEKRIENQESYPRVRLKGTEKLELVGSLATMLSSGISILEVVNSLREDAKGGQRDILETMYEDLMQGKHIYVTMNKFPRVFNKVSVNVIRASEEAGTLDVALRDLRKMLQKDMAFADKVKSALMYPAFIVIVFVGILGMILTVVVPKISEVFARLNMELPLPTRIMIWMSDLIVKNTVWFVGSVLLFAGLVGVLLTYRRKQILDVFYHLPIVTDLITQIDVTNFARSLSLLLASGLPITQALELVEEVVIRRRTALVIDNSRKMVLSGKPLSEGFRAGKGYVPNIVIKLVEAGEKTGTLDQSMQEVSEYFDYKVTYTLKTLTALLEPLMLVLVGLVVGGMMLAIIAPVYGLIGQVGG